MTESEGYAWLRRKLKTEVVMLQRIESGSTGLGIPDIFYATNTKHGWIELKSMPSIKL